MTNDLAVMIKKEFDRVDKRFDEIAGTMARQKDLKEVRERLENLEKVSFKQYNFEIKELKRRVKHLEDLFAVK